MGLVLSKNSGAIGYLKLGRDSDVTNFLSAATITDPTQQLAVTQLVFDLKSYSLWTKIKAAYPFVGGTATTHKWNLVNPQDTNAAFRLFFGGGWTHSSTGAKGGGSTNYADTFLVPSTHLTNNNFHFSVYSRTQVSANEYEMGALNLGAGLQHSMGIYTSVTTYKNIIAGNYPTYWANQNNSNTLGFQIGTRIANNNLRLHWNGVNIANNTNLWNSGLVDLSVYIGAVNYSGGISSTSKELAFASIGDGLTDTDAINYYTAVQKFQTTLNRQV
jgi:hypothetical protein